MTDEDIAGRYVHRWTRTLAVRCPGSSASAIAVGLVLASYADFHDGSDARPSVATLATQTGRHPRSVRRALIDLADAGVIECVGTRGQVNVWQLIAPPAGLYESITDPVTPGNTPGVDPVTPGNTPGVDPVTPGNTPGVDPLTPGNLSMTPGGLPGDPWQIATQPLITTQTKGLSGEDEEGQRPAGAAASTKVDAARWERLQALLPPDWQAKTFGLAWPALVAAVAALDAAAWTDDEIRRGLATMAPARKADHPTAVVAAHISRMVTAGPDSLSTPTPPRRSNSEHSAARSQPTPTPPRLDRAALSNPDAIPPPDGWRESLGVSA